MEEKFSQVISLEEVNKGAVTDLFKDEYQKVLNNLADEDTSWRTQREITIKLKVKLNSEERNTAVSLVEVSSKLAPPKPNEEIIHLDFDGKNVQSFSREQGKQVELDNISNIEEAR